MAPSNAKIKIFTHDKKTGVLKYSYIKKVVHIEKTDVLKTLDWWALYPQAEDTNVSNDRWKKGSLDTTTSMAITASSAHLKTPLSSDELCTSHPSQTFLSSKSLSFTPIHNTQIDISYSNKNKLYAIADSWKWRTKVSFFQGFLVKEKDVKKLKEELLEAIAPLDRGAEASQEDQERVDEVRAWSSNLKLHFLYVFNLSMNYIFGVCHWIRFLVNWRQQIKWRNLWSPSCWMENGSLYIQHLNQFSKQRFEISQLLICQHVLTAV